MPRIEGQPIGPGNFAPLIKVTLALPNGVRGMGFALLDSGADESIVPAEVVIDAGIPWESLTPIAPSKGVGGSMERRMCQGTLMWRKWMIREPEVVVGEPGKLDVALLGRMDFFEKFVVRFLWNRNPPVFDADPVT